MNGDEEGHITCFTSNGCSAVDYSLVSSQLFSLVELFKIDHYDEYTHLPQTLNIRTRNREDNNCMGNDYNENCNNSRTYFTWSEDSLNIMLSSRHYTVLEQEIESGNIDLALEHFSMLIQESCVAKKKKKSNRKKLNEDWWDNEMKDLKSRKHRCLRLLRKIPCENNLIEYRNIKKLYKTKIKQKKELLKSANRKK